MPRVIAASRTARLSSATDRPSRLKLLVRRQRRKLRPALAGIVLLAGCGAIALVVRESVVQGRVGSLGSQSNIGTFRESFGALVGLRVTDVVVDGRSNTPEPLVHAAIGVMPGEPILGFSVADARARLESLSWVQSATVSRRLPGTIVVSLVERHPFAVWQNQGKFMLIDRDGHPVPDQDVAAFGQLPLVVGIGAPAPAPALLDALAAYPVIKSHVVAAVRVGERRWNLHLTNGGDVLLPEGQVPAALQRLAELQTAHALLDRPLQVIDLRLPDRLVVRPAADAAHPDPIVAEAPHPPPTRETR